MFNIFSPTQFTGIQILELEDCGSTNEFLSALSREKNVPEGFIVITPNQTSGKGQRGNLWHAEPGINLTFSILYKPHFLPIEKQFYLSIAIALGIADAFNTILPTIIKWPNDIYTVNSSYKSKKLGGILIENSIKNNQFENSIIGIGLNINQIEFPIEGPSSLRLETNTFYQPNEILNLVLEKIEKRYLQLKNEQYSLLENHYYNVLYLINKISSFKANNKVFEGEIQGIDQYGSLVINDGKNDLYFAVGEIIFLEKAN